MISIIIPFYNSEKYLKQCINCLLNQTYQKFEAIFINDGSTDNFQSIFDNIHDKRIKLISQKNKGVSAARNAGIKKAKGNYICFLDVDDTYKENYLEKMYTQINLSEADVILCNYDEIYESHINTVKYLWKNQLLEKKEIIKSFIPTLLSEKNELKQFNRCLVWRTMIKKEVTKNVWFDEKVATAEDLLYLLEIYSKVNSIYFIDDSLYNYNRYVGSTLDRYQENLLEKQLYLHSRIIEILKKSKCYNLFYEQYQDNRLKMYTSILSNCVRTDKKDAKKQIKELIINFNEDDIIQNVRKKSLIHIINIILLKMRCKTLLYYIYRTKEKIRRKKLKGSDK